MWIIRHEHEAVLNHLLKKEVLESCNSIAGRTLCEYDLPLLLEVAAVFRPTIRRI
jgi:hypothetical protein